MARDNSTGRAATRCPIGAVWWEDQLWSNTSPRTVVARSLAREPRALVHLEGPQDVVIGEGVPRNREVASLPSEIVVAYANTYGGESTPSEDPSWVWFALAPRCAMTWSFADIRNTAGRYDFEEPA